jgi:hypothetical protein
LAWIFGRPQALRQGWPQRALVQQRRRSFIVVIKDDSLRVVGGGAESGFGVTTGAIADGTWGSRMLLELISIVSTLTSSFIRLSGAVSVREYTIVSSLTSSFAVGSGF